METERLYFRRYKKSDKSFLINLFTDAKVMSYVDNGVMTETQAEEWWRKLFEKFYPQDLQIWAIFTNAESEYVGHAGIYPRPMQKEDWEFVYVLNYQNWSKGYATEIARRIIKFGFEELNLPKIFATVDDIHNKSINVLHKAGMNFEKYEYDKEGRFSVYSIENKLETNRPESMFSI